MALEKFVRSIILSVFLKMNEPQAFSFRYLSFLGKKKENEKGRENP